MRVLRFHVWRNHFDARLVRRIHRGRGEIIRVAVDDQPQRLFPIPGAKIEFERVQLGEAHERQIAEVRGILPIPLRNQRKNIMPAVVPGACRRTRILAGDHTKFRKRRRAGESFIRKNLVSCRMIDRQQSYLIQINCLFHGLEEEKAQHPIARLYASRGHLQVFIRIGNVPLSWRSPMPHHSRPNHVGNKFIFMPIPRKKNRA